LSHSASPSSSTIHGTLGPFGGPIFVGARIARERLARHDVGGAARCRSASVTTKRCALFSFSPQTNSSSSVSASTARSA
jgi:hypothetical protein